MSLAVNTIIADDHPLFRSALRQAAATSVPEDHIKETFIELQLLHYIISVWLYNIKQKEELVPVIPIVFHHGKDKPVLNAFDRFNKLPDELKKYLPTFECELIDTTNLSNDDIKRVVRQYLNKDNLVTYELTVNKKTWSTPIASFIALSGSGGSIYPFTIHLISRLTVFERVAPNFTFNVV